MVEIKIHGSLDADSCMYKGGCDFCSQLYSTCFVHTWNVSLWASTATVLCRPDVHVAYLASGIHTLAWLHRHAIVRVRTQRHLMATGQKERNSEGPILYKVFAICVRMSIDCWWSRGTHPAGIFPTSNFLLLSYSFASPRSLFSGKGRQTKTVAGVCAVGVDYVSGILC